MRSKVLGVNLLVTLEGIEGSGKSVLSKYLKKYLEERDFDVVRVKEPSEFLENKIRENNGYDFHPEINALLFAADRLKQYDETIKPAKEEKDFIIMDRSVISSLAYQSSLDVDREWLDRINQYMPLPDLIVYLDVDPEVGLKRISDRFEDSEFDQMVNNLEFQKKVRRRYLEIVKEFKDMSIVVDTNNNTQEDLVKNIGNTILERIES